MKPQIYIALALGLSIFVVLGLIKFIKIRNAISEHANFQPPPETVTSVITNSETWTKQLQSVATLTAEQGAILSAELSGQVDSINFTPGQFVDKGQVLLTLNSTTEKAQLTWAIANLKQAENEFARAQILRAKNANSEADLDSAQSKLAEAKANVVNLEQMIQKKSVTAPFPGKTGIRTVNIGDFVREGTALVPLFSNSKLYADFSLPQHHINMVKTGQTVNISINESDELIPGNVEALNPNIDISTRNFAVRAIFDNSAGLLAAGMFVKVFVETDQKKQVIPVPASSISYAPYGNTVWVIVPSTESDQPRKIEQQFVKLGEKRGDLIAVETGLTAGQEIVSSGTFKLRPGLQVVVNNAILPASDRSPNLPNS